MLFSFNQHHSVSEEIGLSLSIPVISAGSFGLSCNYKPKLTRILPPARKVSDMMHYFMNSNITYKSAWKHVYVYKNTVNATEECFWWGSTLPGSRSSALSDFVLPLTLRVSLSLSRPRYVNALEAASENFASNIDREMLRGEDELKTAMKSSERHSNSGSLMCYFHSGSWLSLTAFRLGRGSVNTKDFSWNKTATEEYPVWRWSP